MIETNLAECIIESGHEADLDISMETVIFFEKKDRFHLKSRNLDYIDSELAYGPQFDTRATAHPSWVDTITRTTAQLSLTAENGPLKWTVLGRQ